MSRQRIGKAKKIKKIATSFLSCFQICQRWKVKPIKMLVNMNSSWLTIEIEAKPMGFYPNHFSHMPK